QRRTRGRFRQADGELRPDGSNEPTASGARASPSRRLPGWIIRQRGSRAFLHRGDRVQNLALVRESLFLVLIEDFLSVHPYIEDAVAQADELRLQAELLANRVCQTGSPRQVVSSSAVFDLHLHHVDPFRGSYRGSPRYEHLGAVASVLSSSGDGTPALDALARQAVGHPPAGPRGLSVRNWALGADSARGTSGRLTSPRGHEGRPQHGSTDSRSEPGQGNDPSTHAGAHSGRGDQPLARRAAALGTVRSLPALPGSGADVREPDRARLVRRE